MKLDNVVPFGRPQSGTVIIQLMTELDVSNNQIPEQQYQNRIESKAMPYFFRLKIACHNAHILEIYNLQKFKNAMRWYFCQAHFMLFVLKPNDFCKPEQREDNSNNLPIEHSKFRYELTF